MVQFTLDTLNALHTAKALPFLSGWALVYYKYLQLGGPDGELAASLRYLNQRYTMPNAEAKGLLTDIGVSVSEYDISKTKKEKTLLFTLM